ncbi:ureidoglycolate lyase [Pragia fontium]|uniref:Ureidoglycolate lyase n=2 Tax=Pragia fontium TaxID=82985 RepID=A0AAJ5BFX1_9GAMM|nr:ureidoglycolate lyase [Pragia fontium]AKJ41250.1 ureidoglycolate hydrolase [Pragia fontium]SFC08100.1 ureidoglycolate lyase [Pragia fontium DSM 5563 = ATCC 49100]SUB81472.1 Ureidoglycolate hydrolase [Pragia fontium]VEJ53783.1 Ureidoglycolate hydrolase [Pragia fontium]GKX62790.1 ureidoglycolate lyase [Pragia fontium]
MKLEVEVLTREAFKPYGDVIQIEGASSFFINEGMTERFHDLAKVEFFEQDRVLMSINKAKPSPMPIKVSLLEKHPLGTQAFMPLRGEKFVIIVAQPGEDIDTNTLRAFITDGTQGVNYHCGVWHHPLFAYQKETEFFTVDRAGENNCVVKKLPNVYELEL